MFGSGLRFARAYTFVLVFAGVPSNMQNQVAGCFPPTGRIVELGHMVVVAFIL